MTEPRSKYRGGAGDRDGGDFAARHLGDCGGEGRADGGAAGVCSGRGLLCGQGEVGVSTVDSDPRRNDFSGLGVDVKEMETFGGAAAGLKENPVSKVTSRLTGTTGAWLDAGIGWQIGVRGGLEMDIGRIAGRAAAGLDRGATVLRGECSAVQSLVSMAVGWCLRLCARMSKTVLSVGFWSGGGSGGCALGRTSSVGNGGLAQTLAFAEYTWLRGGLKWSST